MVAAAPTLFGPLLNRAIWSAARCFRGSFGQVATPGAHAAAPGRIRGAGIELGTLHWPGGGPPVVLLHGLDSSPWTWARVAARLAPAHDTWAIALRGHGQSDTPTQGYALEDTTADLAAALPALLSAPFHLIGHSWGGKVALHFAAHHPAQVRSLVLADPAPPEGLHPLVRAIPGAVQAALYLERREFTDELAFARGRHDVLFLLGDDEIDRMLWEDMFRRTSDGRYLPRLPEAAFHEILERAINADIRHLLPDVAQPTLLLTPPLSVSLPGQLRPLAGMKTRLRSGFVWGDHTFPHCNPVDTHRQICAFLASLG